MPAQHRNKSLFPVNFMTGISDGLVLPLVACIIALPFSAEQPFMTLGIGGTVTLFGALVFGWARYAGEQEEIRHKHPELGLEEAEKELSLLKAIGIDETLTASMKEKMEEERILWLREIRENEMDWEQHDKKRALRGAVHTGAGFLTGGILVTLPFTLVTGQPVSAVLPVAWALACSCLLGWAKGKITGRNPVSALVTGGLRALVLITLAGLIAWVVSRLWHV